MSAVTKPIYISPEEYLHHENDRDDNAEKCEYANGLVYMVIA